jgi:hypothetical protein
MYQSSFALQIHIFDQLAKRVMEYLMLCLSTLIKHEEFSNCKRRRLNFETLNAASTVLEVSKVLAFKFSARTDVNCKVRRNQYKFALGLPVKVTTSLRLVKQ